MSIQHPDFEKRHIIDAAARRAIESHGQPEHALNQEAREMRESQHTGKELTAAELAYLRKMALDKILHLQHAIDAKRRSLESGFEANRSNAEEEIRNGEMELQFLQHNLYEKLASEETPT